MGYIKVQVLSGSKKEAITEKGDVLYISVREKAKQGAANRRMLELARVHFGAGRRVRIVSGHHSPHKIISVD